MKNALRILMCAVVLVGVIACEEKPQTLGDKVKDGLDARPNEKVKDAAEDVKDAVKDVVK
jgi:hypothetical protein